MKRQYLPAGSRFALLVVVALLNGCASKPPEPAKMKAQVTGARVLNPDRYGISKPVKVRIYQLRTAGAFEAADFYSLYEDAEAVLAADLLASREFFVDPEQVIPIEAEFDPEARVIGVMAAFRDIENAQWRTSLALPEGKLIKFLDKRQMLIDLDDRTVTLQFAKPPE